MKAIIAFCLFVLSVDAVINQPSQDAQRREAPTQQYGPPPAAVRQHKIQAMQRLIAAMRNGGGYASQGRVVNRPRPIPISQPQNSYGPPKNSYGPPASSSSGSLANFMNSHNPDVRCDGWVPIPGPSVGSGDYHSSGGSASSGGHVDSSYGPPRHGSGNSGLNTQVIVVPDDSYGPPGHSGGESSGIPDSYSESHHGHSSGGSSGVSASYTVSGHSSSGSSGDSYGPPPPVQIASSYGPPNHGSGGSSGGSSFSSSGHSSSGSSGDSYGPPPPVQIASSYGPPNHGSGSGSSSFSASGHSSSGSSGVSDSYGPPHHGNSGSGSSGFALSNPVDSYGPPPVPQPSGNYGAPNHEHSSGPVGHQTYGPPAPVYIPTKQSHSGHSSHSSQSSHQSGSSSGYAAPQVGHATYGPPEIQPKAPESSYGPPASGHSHSGSHDESHHSSQGHAQSIQSIGQELELPGIDSGDQFNSAIGLVTSSLGVSAGHNEVVQSHAIHESHTSELANNFNGGDSYTAPPLDSYEPGKYAPSFLKPRPQPPAQSYLPQRPPSRPHYIPPVKISRPQPHPQQQYRPQFNSHAQSIAQGYSSGQSHSQSIHSAGPVRQQPKYPLPHRAPVPNGLLQSIGQHVQALDDGHRSQQVVPNHGPSQPFLSQHQLHHSGSSSSSSNSAYSYQNQELRNVHIIHDCGKGPQLSGPPHQSYGTPLGQPLTNYQSADASQISSLSSNYEIPQVPLEVPQQNSIDFNSVANSYGPPASGPASLDVLGLESTQRANSVISSEQQQISDAGLETHVTNHDLPGLSDGLSGSGLNFLSAQKSQSIEIPANGGQIGNFELQFTQSHSDQNNNRIDAPSHQQILADGLLQSILTAIEQKPMHAVPQVTDDLETDHSEVQVFLKSPEGQEVLADKPVASSEEA